MKEEPDKDAAVLKRKRFGIAARMAIWAAISGTLTAVGVAGLMHMESSTAVEQLERLSTSEALERATVHLKASLDRLKQDTTILSTLPPIQGLVRSSQGGGVDPLDGSTEVLWRDRLAHIFASFLEERSDYYQIRFVSAADGLEIVRVNKTGDRIQRTPDSKLQSKAARPYFQRTLKLDAGEPYLSQFELNREFGKVEEPFRPTVRASTPIFDEKTGAIFGMIVINANAQEYFQRMAAVLESGQTLVVANADGDYLHHPNPMRAFGFDRGQRHRIQDDFPEIELADRESENHEKIVHSPDGHSELHEKRVSIDPDRPERYLTLGVMGASLSLDQPIGTNGLWVILAVVLFILGSTAVQVVWTRFLARSLKELTTAAENLRYRRRDVDLSHIRDRNDETGELAQAFETMAEGIKDRESALRDQSKKLLQQKRELSKGVAKLSDLNTQLSAVTEAAIDGLIVIDEAGIIQSFNPAAERMFGYVEEEVVGQNVTVLMPEPYRQDHDHFIRSFKEVGQGQATGEAREVRARRKDGTVFPIELGVSPMTVGGRQLFLETTSDISRKKAVERQKEERFIARLQRSNEELKQARAAAEAATAAKSEFLANMTHELRTPLNSIVGFAGLLSKSPTLADQNRRFAKIIDTSSRSLLALVNDILDFSGLEAGAVELHPVPFSLLKLAEEVAASVSLMADEKNLTIKIEKGNTVADAHFGDPVRLHQVLLNLVNNAVKFTDRGGVTIAISAYEHSDSVQHLRVEVRDTGIGIAPERVKQIFQRFTQANSSIHGKYGGTGLGLAISKRLVDMMGGEIGVESIEEKGTTVWFEVTLPCVGEDALVGAGVTEEPEATASPMRILVVDDVDLNRDLVSALLSPLGHDVSEAADGAEAVEAVKGGDFDIVLMDVQMPGMNGQEATRAIRAMGGIEELPIIAMTAQALASQWEACREAGMSDHLPKPITPAALRAMLEKWSAGGNGSSTVTATPDAVSRRVS